MANNGYNYKRLIMIRKKVSFALAFVCLIVGLTACIEGGNKSSDSWYAVVGQNTLMGGKTLITRYGELAVADPLSNLYPGDCVFAHYAIDYDNQPSATYYTATEVQVSSAIDESYVRIVDELIEDDPNYNGTMDAVLAYYLPSFWGKVIFEISYTGYSEQSQSYALICNPEEKDSNGNMNMYLKAKKGGEESGSTITTGDRQVFDLYYMINTYGRDTTFTDGMDSYKYKYVKTYIKYCSKIDEDGACTYTDLTSRPTEILIPAGTYPFFR